MWMFRGRAGQRCWHSLALAILAGGVAVTVFLSQVGQPLASADPAPEAKPAAPLAAAPANPLDQPIAWLQEAKKNHSRIRDYTCTLGKQERIKGQLQPENVIAFKYRNLPFSVNMRWLAPQKNAKQEVSYVHGWNNGQMRVHAPGLLGGVAGWKSIDPRDPRVMEHSRHTIYEAGIGNLINHTLRNWDMERRVNKTKVHVSEYDYNNRRCLRIETTRPERIQGFYCYRSVLYIDKETKLPVRTENYDWPRAGGPAGGDLLESFSFIDLRFNVGLTDADFMR
jgi:hypothetical protein